MSINIDTARRHLELVSHRSTAEQRVKELTIALRQMLRELERLNLKIAKLEAKKQP